MKMTDHFTATATKHWPWYSILQIDATVCCSACIKRLQRMIKTKEKREEQIQVDLEDTECELRSNLNSTDFETKNYNGEEGTEITEKKLDVTNSKTPKHTYYKSASHLKTETNKELQSNKRNVIKSSKTSKLLLHIVMKLCRNIPTIDCVNNYIILTD